jgi:hypothetical protein
MSGTTRSVFGITRSAVSGRREDDPSSHAQRLAGFRMRIVTSGLRFGGAKEWRLSGKLL